jgi:capsular exopolysaccharide synthesis family protein
MSSNDVTSVAVHPAVGGSASAAEAAWASGEGGNMTVWLHAFRRRWLLAVSLGLALAAAAGSATWLAYGRWYEASAYLRMDKMEPRVLYSTTAPYDAANEFEIFKGTQQQLIKSRMVLSSALRKKDVQELALDRRFQDPVAWLADELVVRFPGRAEIMEIALRSDKPEEAAALVQAVMDAYLTDVVDADRSKRVERLSTLDRANSEKENEVRTARNDMKRLAEQFGTTDKETLSVIQQITMSQFADYQRELLRVQFELRRAKGELDGAAANLEQLEESELPELEVEEYLRYDPAYRPLADDLAWRQMDWASVQTQGSGGRQLSTQLTRQRTESEALRAQLADMRNGVREGLRDKRRTEIEKERRKWETDFDVLQTYERELAKEVKRRGEDAERLSSAPIELEMRRSELENLERVLKGIAEEREKLRVELRSPRRINPINPKVEKPITEFLPSVHIALTVLAMIAGFAIPVALVVWGDSRSQRINSGEELVGALRLPVLGALPIIPQRAVRTLGAPTKGHLAWRMRMAESADSVAARLLRHAGGQSQVVLITSAVGGEGKTTVATQLAMSLARNGRRTLLVDFNLRRPALDHMFDLATEPGISDVLRGEGQLDDMVHATVIDNLSVLTAGRWDRAAMTALAKGGAQQVFARLRQQFEFVIVDSSSLLPVADTRFVSQHVDLVVLSVVRDVSRLPKVRSAKEIVEAFGVRHLEAVFTGPGEDLHDRDLGYGV